MAPQDAPTPREFGEALAILRAERHVTIDELAERTKISRRVLEALEHGDFGTLPPRVFARMFLRQVLAVVKEPAEAWLVSFDRAFDRFELSSQSFPAISPRPQRPHRVWPWIAALGLVTGGFLLVFVIDRGGNGRPATRVPPTPEVLLREALASPTAAPTAAATPTAAPTPIPTVLIIRTAARACWAEANVDGGGRSQRMMAADSTWEIDAQGRAVEILLGDAGGVEIEYLGRLMTSVGQPGEVVRLRLGPPVEP